MLHDDCLSPQPGLGPHAKEGHASNTDLSIWSLDPMIQGEDCYRGALLQSRAAQNTTNQLFNSNHTK